MNNLLVFMFMLVVAAIQYRAGRMFWFGVDMFLAGTNFAGMLYRLYGIKNFERGKNV